MIFLFSERIVPKARVKPTRALAFLVSTPPVPPPGHVQAGIFPGARLREKKRERPPGCVSIPAATATTQNTPASLGQGSPATRAASRSLSPLGRTRKMQGIRCGRCNKKLAEADDYTRLNIVCPRCRAMNQLSATSAMQERHPSVKPLTPVTHDAPASTTRRTTSA